MSLKSGNTWSKRFRRRTNGNPLPYPHRSGTSIAVIVNEIPYIFDAGDGAWHAKGLILIGQVVRDKLYELVFSIAITFGVIFISAALLYLAEGTIQPEQFGSIPRALWWASSTLTTISYGDVIPITVIGKILTMIITVASIGIVAIPTGILAAGFSEALSKQKELNNN